MCVIRQNLVYIKIYCIDYKHAKWNLKGIDFLNNFKISKNIVKLINIRFRLAANVIKNII